MTVAATAVAAATAAVPVAIRVGGPVRLPPRVIRMTAGNGGPTTGPGTDSDLPRAGARDDSAA